MINIILRLPKKMQFSGYVIVHDEKIKVLARTTKTYLALKLRISGKDGHYLEDESIGLSQSPMLLESLKAGEIVKC